MRRLVAVAPRRTVVVNAVQCGHHIGPSPVERISRSVRAKLEAQQHYFDHHLPFSWRRCLFAVVSYALLLTDAARSGLGIQEFRAKYAMLAPSELQFYGPFNYLVHNSTDDVSVWAHKFDTSSIVWRAFAQFFNLDVFPSCLLYRGECVGTVIGRDVAFAIGDGMANATAQRQRHRHGPVVVTLRTENTYRDRFHHYLLPSLFKGPIVRTHQATHFPSTMTRAIDFHICGRHGGGVDIPLSCRELWTNYHRSCAATDTACRAVGVVWNHVIVRLRQTQNRFPGHAVDLTILEGRDDMQVCRGGLSFLSRAQVDISTIIRARKCTDANDCETVFVEDYRYETIVVASDLENWFGVVALLRTLGQAYCYARVLLLMWSCYMVRAAEDADDRTSSCWARVRRGLFLFVRVPSQAVVYGSSIPIFCYALAHCIDAPNTYQILEHRFSTQLGLFKLNLPEFVRFAAIQMRSIWLLAAAAHLGVWFSTSYYWAPTNGLPGIPEYLIAKISSATIASQLRTLSFRNVNIESIHELSVSHRTATSIKQFTSGPLSGNKLLEGVLIDLKFVLCEYLVLLSVLLIWCVIPRFLRGLLNRATQSDESPPALSMGRTPIPFSGGALWPTAAMCILWRGHVFHTCEPAKSRSHSSKHRSLESTHQVTTITPDDLIRSRLAPRPSTTLITRFRRSTRRLFLRRHSSSSQLSPSQQETLMQWPTGATSDETVCFLQYHLERVYGRPPDIDAVVAFINLVHSSDPCVWLRLRLHGSHRLVYCHCPTGGNAVVLLPEEIVQQWFVLDEQELLMSVDAAQLPWAHLMQCG